MPKSNKGGKGEREIAVALGLWWSGGKRDDLFWRTSQSGGRATVRSRKNKTTGTHAADLCAIDPLGQPLIDLLAIEVKTGYTKFTSHDALDIADPKNANDRRPNREFEGFITQAIAAQKNGRACSWCLIHKRNNRDPTIWFPRAFVQWLNKYACLGCGSFPVIRMHTRDGHQIFGTTLAALFSEVTPKQFRQLHRHWKQNGRPIL